MKTFSSLSDMTVGLHYISLRGEDLKGTDESLYTNAR